MYPINENVFEEWMLNLTEVIESHLKITNSRKAILIATNILTLNVSIC